MLSKKTKLKYRVKKKKSKHPRTTIQVFDKWCKRCHICMDLCEQKVLVEDENGFPTPVKPVECNHCEWCVLRCPDFAIAITSRDK